VFFDILNLNIRSYLHKIGSGPVCYEPKSRNRNHFKIISTISIAIRQYNFVKFCKDLDLRTKFFKEIEI